MAVGRAGVGKGIRPMLALEKPHEPPTHMRVNLKIHKKMNGMDVGKKVHFRGHGKITAINKDQYGHSMSMDVHQLEPGEMP